MTSAVIGQWGATKSVLNVLWREPRMTSRRSNRNEAEISEKSVNIHFMLLFWFLERNVKISENVSFGILNSCFQNTVICGCCLEVEKEVVVRSPKTSKQKGGGLSNRY
jgi:hypothetical protein